ncbi:MAG: molecular chaperone TorD family protein [Gordonibacter sp.]
MNETIEAVDDGAPWRIRATTCELLALSFSYPTGVLAEAVSTGEWAEAAREVTEALDVALPDNFSGMLAPYEVKHSEEVLHLLRVEATRLFVGAPEPVVSPYEGVHRAQADGVQALLFVNPHSMEVERFMKACGLGRPEGTNEPLDHVSTECELLEHLALRAAAAASEGAAPADPREGAPERFVPDGALPGGSPEVAYESFLEEHVRAWMPGFAEAVTAETREPFYRAAAAMLLAIVG